MKKRQWHSGPPPEIGWWPASVFGNPRSIRWWDGERWSVLISMSCDANTAARFANRPTFNHDQIKWTERWWE